MRLNLDQDIRPVSEFRAHTRDFLRQIRSTRRPLILTQRGKSAAVVLDVAEYERLMNELELLRDVRTADHQLESGDAIEHDEALRLVLQSISK